MNLLKKQNPNIKDIKVANVDLRLFRRYRSFLVNKGIPVTADFQSYMARLLIANKLLTKKELKEWLN